MTPRTRNTKKTTTHAERDRSAEIADDAPARNSIEEIEAWLDGIDEDPTVEVFDGEPLRRIAAARKRAELADDELRSAVAAARADGHSWAAIGAVLGGIPRQAAQQRFS